MEIFVERHSVLREDLDELIRRTWVHCVYSTHRFEDVRKVYLLGGDKWYNFEIRIPGDKCYDIVDEDLGNIVGSISYEISEEGGILIEWIDDYTYLYEEYPEDGYSEVIIDV